MVRNQRSAWRVNDAVAYEELRRALDAEIASMLEEGAGDPSPDVLAEIATLRRRVFAVEGFDRDAVDLLRSEIEARPTRTQVPR